MRSVFISDPRPRGACQEGRRETGDPCEPRWAPPLLQERAFDVAGYLRDYRPGGNGEGASGVPRKAGAQRGAAVGVQEVREERERLGPLQFEMRCLNEMLDMGAEANGGLLSDRLWQTSSKKRITAF